MGQIGQLTEGEIEQEIQNKGLIGSMRLTPHDIDAQIAHEAYWIVPLTTTTICAMTLKNGYTVIGKSACVNPDAFDADIGRKIAYDDARSQIWALEGYRLASIKHALRRLEDGIDKGAA